jgi:hypothetical protein
MKNINIFPSNDAEKEEKRLTFWQKVKAAFESFAEAWAEHENFKREHGITQEMFWF